MSDRMPVKGDYVQFLHNGENVTERVIEIRDNVVIVNHEGSNRSLASTNDYEFYRSPFSTTWQHREKN